MYQFSVTSNKIFGSIPQSFLNMRRMKYLYLSNNQLTGSIPLTLALKQEFSDGLRVLSLNSNRLEGKIKYFVWVLSKSKRKLVSWHNTKYFW